MEVSIQAKTCRWVNTAYADDQEVCAPIKRSLPAKIWGEKKLTAFTPLHCCSAITCFSIAMAWAHDGIIPSRISLSRMMQAVIHQSCGIGVTATRQLSGALPEGEAS